MKQTYSDLEILEKQLEAGTVSHAYIFECLNADDALNEALIFISKYNDINTNDLNYDITKERNARDLSIIKPDGKTITIDKIRDLISFFRTGPFQNKYKTAIIYEADKLRVESSNAMLKLLEDMPSYGKIILIVKSSKRLLPTILSRCQLIRLGSKSGESQNIDYNFVYDLIDALIAGKIYYIAEHRKEIEENKDNGAEFFSAIIEYLGMISFFNQISIGDEDLSRRISENYSQRNIDHTKLNEVVLKCIEVQKNLYNNVNFLLSVERIALDLNKL